MEYRCKVTVLDKKLFPELQAEYCAVPDSGKCPATMWATSLFSAGTASGTTSGTAARERWLNPGSRTQSAA